MRRVTSRSDIDIGRPSCGKVLKAGAAKGSPDATALETGIDGVEADLAPAARRLEMGEDEAEDPAFVFGDEHAVTRVRGSIAAIVSR